MKKKICVLEDNAEIMDILTIIFEEANYDVYGFTTVAGFLLNVSGLNPDICLLDVMLPDGNGLSVCAQIRGNDVTSHIPIVMMSAGGDIGEMGNKCIAEDFIAKPFDIYNLYDRVNRLIVA
jgi:DNA-binding response OmpR family regulator